MDRHDDPQLWDILGKSSAPELSPFFARNVLRAIRQQPTMRERIAGMFVARRLVPLTGVAAILIAAATFLHVPKFHSRSVDALDAQDAALVADLDDSTPGDDSDLFDDTALL